MFTRKPYVLFGTLLWLILLNDIDIHAQCSRVSTCGYTVYQQYTALNIVPSSTSCPFGFNYNVRFSYSITVVGTNTCSNGTIGLQPRFFCNGGQSNGYFTITQSAPTVGAGSTTTSITGTLVTTTNPYRSATDCNTVTPTSLNCNSLNVTSYGPGLTNATNACTIQILPVRFIDFKGTADKNRTTLQWRTASEKNSDYFQVNRYDETLKDWVAIGTVPAAGESNRILTYAFTDAQVSQPHHYYQLQQFDKDGGYMYSQIVYVSTPAENNGEGIIQFSSEIPISVKGKYTIYNMSGMAVSSGYTQNNPISAEGFLPGIYYMNVEGSNGPVQYKLYKSE